MTASDRIDDIERLVNRSSAGPNEPALRTIREHVFALRGEVTSGYAATKLSGIQSWAEIYFSQRKHQKRAGGGEQVAVWILADCKAVKDSL